MIDLRDEDLITNVIEWDIANWSRCLVFWRSFLTDCKNKVALEIGSGRGGISLWLALNGMRVICSDIIDPRNTALSLHNKYNAEKINYETIDATNIPYRDYFDVIVFKSVLGGIGRDGNIAAQSKAIKEMHKSLKKGGMLLFCENLQGSALHRFFRTRYQPWGDSWRYITISEMKKYLADFSEVKVKTVGFLGCFGRNEAQRRMLARIDNMITLLVPENWRYVIIGIAVK